MATRIQPSRDRRQATHYAAGPATPPVQAKRKRQRKSRPVLGNHEEEEGVERRDESTGVATDERACLSPRPLAVEAARTGLQCTQVLGGCFGCELPAYHAGAHDVGVSRRGARREVRLQHCGEALAADDAVPDVDGRGDRAEGGARQVVVRLRGVCTVGEAHEEAVEARPNTPAPWLCAHLRHDDPSDDVDGADTQPEETGAEETGAEETEAEETEAAETGAADVDSFVAALELRWSPGRAEQGRCNDVMSGSGPLSAASLEHEPQQEDIDALLFRSDWQPPTTPASDGAGGAGDGVGGATDAAHNDGCASGSPSSLPPRFMWDETHPRPVEGMQSGSPASQRAPLHDSNDRASSNSPSYLAMSAHGRIRDACVRASAQLRC